MHILVPFIVFIVVLLLSIISVHTIFVGIKNYVIRNNTEKMINISPINSTNIKWKQDETCKYRTNKTLKNIMKNNSVLETDNNNWNVYIPCTYNNIKEEISKIKPTNKQQRIYIIDKADSITSKSSIWKHIVNKYGRNMAKKLMPNSYILSDNDDINLLKKEFNKDKLYIMKKNIQRQKGLHITNNLDKIISGKKDKYVIVQELLQDPYLIDNRKINMRIYMLITCQNGKIGGYIHNDGFIYYTKVAFIKNSLDDGPNITTGYIDRQVYEKNPLTLEDLKIYLDSVSRHRSDYEKELMNKNISISRLVFGRIVRLFHDILLAVDNILCVTDKLDENVTFQLFGADISLNDRLYPQLIEINKGPDLSIKDERDGAVKRKVQEDILKIIKIIPDNDKDNEFIPVY